MGLLLNIDACLNISRTLTSSNENQQLVGYQSYHMLFACSSSFIILFYSKLNVMEAVDMTEYQMLMSPSMPFGSFKYRLLSLMIDRRYTTTVEFRA